MKILCTAFLLLIFLNNINATQITVSKNPNIPAQYSNLQTAINNAMVGDTIIVAGAIAYYENLVITKKVYLIGNGMNHLDPNSSKLQNITLSSNSLTEVASGTVISGFVVDGQVAFASNIAVAENIVINRCRISAPIYLQGSQLLNNVTITNCLLSTIVFAPNNQNINIENCIFYTTESSHQGNANGQGRFKNCLFINHPSNLFGNLSGAVFENNIFYNANPAGVVTNCIFNNNLTYLCNNNSLPPAGSGNTGSNNIINQNPLFINFPALGGPFSWTHNYGLQTGSLGDNAGINGTDIGLTGGTYPLNQLKEYSKLPVVTSVTLPNSSVPLNGTLQGNIKAKVRN